MTLNHALSLISLSGILAITGCAETKTLGSSVGKGVSSVVNGVFEGVKQGLGGTEHPTTQQAKASTTSVNKVATHHPMSNNKASYDSTTDWTPYLQPM